MTETNTPPDWKIFIGINPDQSAPDPHDGIAKRLPDPPPWRSAHYGGRPQLPDKPKAYFQAEASRAKPFRPTAEMIRAVNAALYLRRPLLITGKPGTGKSTLIAKVAHELKLGPVLKWTITSRATVRGGVYEYDAVGRLQGSRPGKAPPPVESYLTLGPLGTALAAQSWPRPLLIDEIDKSDLDLANDLLNVIEDGNYDIPELKRLGRKKPVTVLDSLGEPVKIKDGTLTCGQFPFVVMTSNAEREFPAPFLRRCIRLTIQPPGPIELAEIVKSHLSQYLSKEQLEEVTTLSGTFHADALKTELATDQLLNAVFLTIGMNDGRERSLGIDELKELRQQLLKPLTAV
jgi:MoxR-like ATPase